MGMTSSKKRKRGTRGRKKQSSKGVPENRNASCEAEEAPRTEFKMFELLTQKRLVPAPGEAASDYPAY